MGNHRTIRSYLILNPTIMQFNEITLKLKEVKRGKMFAKIKRHSEGSFYRQNAQSADCYAFRYDIIGETYRDASVCKKLDYSGGWDWINCGIIDKEATHLYEFKTKKFFQIISF